MLIKFVKSPTSAPYLLAYNSGDEADIEPAVARDLIDQGIAIAVTTKPAETTEKAISPAAVKAEKR